MNYSTAAVLCILAAVWLRNRFALGGWVVAAGVVLGLGAAFMSLWQNLRAMDRQAKEDDRDTGTNFNDHR